ncbi:MAG: HlyD family efflux transporter periplasmic adaptor subunit [Cyanobacteria bacterium P01_G01_bin.54]
MNKVWIAAIFAVGILSGAIATYALRSLPSNSESLAESEAETANIEPDAVSALGRLEPQDKVLNLAPPSTAAQARVEELRVKEGDWVAPNQVIAILDSHDERQAELTEAKTQISNAQARLSQVRAGAQRGEINAQVARISESQAQLAGNLQAQDAQIARLEAEAANAVVEYNRYQELLDEGATSESNRDARYTTMLAAQKQLEEAREVRARLAATGNDRVQAERATLDRIREVRPVDVRVAQTDVDSARAALKRAEVALQDTIIRAPVAGQILQIHTQPGEVAAADGLVTMGQTDAMYAIAEVYEADIERVEVGQKATVRSEYGGFAGELSGIVEKVGLEVLSNSLYDPNPISQSEARIIEVKVRLDDSDSERVSDLTNLQVRVLIDAD